MEHEKSFRWLHKYVRKKATSIGWNAMQNEDALAAIRCVSDGSAILVQFIASKLYCSFLLSCYEQTKANVDSSHR